MPTPLRSALNVVRDRMFLTGTVRSVEHLTPTMRHVTIEGRQLVGLDHTPGRQVRVHVNDLFTPSTWTRLGDALRTYSVWAYDRPAGRLELAVFDHGGDSPGTVWARGLTAGAQVTFGKPEGDLVAREDAAFHVFAAEETGAVACAAMLAGLPVNSRVHGVFEAATPDDQVPMAREDDLVRVHRHGSSAADSALLVKAVADLDLPTGPDHGGVAYLPGEARTIQAIRRHLVAELGWNRRSVLTKPFWTPGKRGME
ncbi:siderophore-interacting protein [Streptomyces sp. NBC_00726]|uniref:siderophore-interacting protein n=1 Tax=Streptomyces sp. NBC_00726 TaxID=2903674 RepID=UPI00386FCD06